MCMSNQKKDWDYGENAKYYIYRPNYSNEAIDELCEYVSTNKYEFKVADVGAGTGNLTTMLIDRGLECIAIEPTPEMMKIGIEVTAGRKVEWRNGTGENTGLDLKSIDWFVMGSSFNTTDRLSTLKEASRILKDRGYFSCMWNNRDIENDPVQKRIEEIILEVIPKYERGIRREGQADYILFSKLFNDVHYIEKTQLVSRTLDEYINAWKSVKNKFWDLHTDDGIRRFEKIIEKIKIEFGENVVFKMNYITKIWTARKI